MSSNKAPLTGWETAELSTLQDGLKLSFRERLLWLQDMLAYADRFGGVISGRKLDREDNIVPVVREESGPNTYRVR
jgi:hypothetical protein